MAHLKAYLRMLLVGGGIFFGGLFVCGMVTFVVSLVSGRESKIMQTTFIVMLCPMLITFLLALAHSNRVFHSTREKLTKASRAAVGDEQKARK